MANEKTSAPRESVQCPVCFKDFKPATINGHLDVCLLKGVTDGSPSATDESGPPLKKPRISAEAAPASPGVNKAVAGTPTTSMFSLFQTNKSKVSVQSERNGSLAAKQSATTAEPGPAGTEPLKSHTPASSGQTLKATHGLSPRTLLTMDRPLAEIMRPNNLEEYFGQSKAVGQQTLLRSLLDSQEVPSLILWGPPGCGKVWW